MPTGESAPAELLPPLFHDAAERAGVDRGKVILVTSLQLVWPDASLACPEPDVAYAPVQTTGYWVVLEAAGSEFDYRSAEDGEFRYCPEGAAAG